VPWVLLAGKCALVFQSFFCAFPAAHPLFLPRYSGTIFFTLCGASSDIFHSFLYWLDFIFTFHASNPFFKSKPIAVMKI